MKLCRFYLTKMITLSFKSIYEIVSQIHFGRIVITN